MKYLPALALSLCLLLVPPPARAQKALDVRPAAATRAGLARARLTLPEAAPGVLPGRLEAEWIGPLGRARFVLSAALVGARPPGGAACAGEIRGVLSESPYVAGAKPGNVTRVLGQWRIDDRGLGTLAAQLVVPLDDHGGWREVGRLHARFDPAQLERSSIAPSLYASPELERELAAAALAEAAGAWIRGGTFLLPDAEDAQLGPGTRASAPPASEALAGFGPTPRPRRPVLVTPGPAPRTIALRWSLEL